jgi:hypothetical protein
MSNNDEDILMFALEVATEDANASLAQSLTKDMADISHRINKLKSILRMRGTNDSEALYVLGELDRLAEALKAVIQQYMLLHNLNLESSFQFDRPNSSNPPD